MKTSLATAVAAAAKALCSAAAEACGHDLDPSQVSAMRQRMQKRQRESAAARSRQIASERRLAAQDPNQLDLL
ncbi:hypothetical protein [Croceicoccus gelatinilyticus]|uniref:hypothetical protein n=1 Tax=Croceicoccus gelatinilyticus TaxID=2835536 RepID=UPI001BCDC31E|nr:hypothetical protein [Croceicoccus gelatinilyticus]MBS7671730.1 hypothetical protein [Croceicoccus gelatinilyticus]